MKINSFILIMKKSQLHIQKDAKIKIKRYYCIT